MSTTWPGIRAIERPARKEVEDLPLCRLCARHPADGPHADLCDRCKTIHEDELADRAAEARAECLED